MLWPATHAILKSHGHMDVSLVGQRTANPEMVQGDSNHQADVCWLISFFETIGHKWILLSWKISIIRPYKLKTVNTKTSLERNIASLLYPRFGWNWWIMKVNPKRKIQIHKGSVSLPWLDEKMGAIWLWFNARISRMDKQGACVLSGSWQAARTALVRSVSIHPSLRGGTNLRWDLFSQRKMFGENSEQPQKKTWTWSALRSCYEKQQIVIVDWDGALSWWRLTGKSAEGMRMMKYS